jgi:hypothetical protein
LEFFIFILVLSRALGKFHCSHVTKEREKKEEERRLKKSYQSTMWQNVVVVQQPKHHAVTIQGTVMNRLKFCEGHGEG